MLARIVPVALVLALACALPACSKRPKSTATDDANTDGTGGPPPGGNPGRDPSAPRSPVYSSAFEAGMRPGSQANLKQIVLGLLSYHDVYNGFPIGIADTSGKPGLSWRVAILPYVEHDNLYKQFRLNEPWDSEHNRRLISQMPPVYAPPRTQTNGYTFYRGFSGPNTWMAPRAGRPAQAGQPLLGVQMSQLLDGTSNTMFVAEGYEPVIWTKPDELEFAPNKLPRLGGVFASGFNVAMADGSVRFVRNGVSPTVLANAIQINDGNPVTWDE